MQAALDYSPISQEVDDKPLRREARKALIVPIDGAIVEEELAVRGQGGPVVRQPLLGGRGDLARGGGLLSLRGHLF